MPGAPVCAPVVIASPPSARPCCRRSRILRIPTAESIHAHLVQVDPGLSLSTVYRNLTVLQELEVITHAHIGSGAPVYHLAETDPHVHLSCLRCGAVASVPGSRPPDLSPPMCWRRPVFGSTRLTRPSTGSARLAPTRQTERHDGCTGPRSRRTHPTPESPGTTAIHCANSASWSPVRRSWICPTAGSSRWPGPTGLSWLNDLTTAALLDVTPGSHAWR